MTDKFKLIISLRRRSEPESARKAGYTKNHSLVEMFFIGKWYTVGFYTNHQISKGIPEKRAQELLKYNARGTVADGFKWNEIQG